MKVIIYAAALLVLIVLVVVCSALVIAGKESRAEEQLEQATAPREPADPCDSCLRWSECNGTNKENCPLCGGPNKEEKTK